MWVRTQHAHATMRQIICQRHRLNSIIPSPADCFPRPVPPQPEHQQIHLHEEGKERLRGVHPQESAFRFRQTPLCVRPIQTPHPTPYSGSVLSSLFICSANETNSIRRPSFRHSWCSPAFFTKGLFIIKNMYHPKILRVQVEKVSLHVLHGVCVCVCVCVFSKPNFSVWPAHDFQIIQRHQGWALPLPGF